MPSAITRASPESSGSAAQSRPANPNSASSPSWYQTRRDFTFPHASTSCRMMEPKYPAQSLCVRRKSGDSQIKSRSTSEVSSAEPRACDPTRATARIPGVRRAQSVTSERNAPTRCTRESYRILGQAGLADWLQRESRLGNARLNPATLPVSSAGRKCIACATRKRPEGTRSGSAAVPAGSLPDH